MSAADPIEFLRRLPPGLTVGEVVRAAGRRFGPGPATAAGLAELAALFRGPAAPDATSGDDGDVFGVAGWTDADGGFRPYW